MANTNDIPSAFLNPEILNIADYFQPDLNARTNCNLSLSDILELIYFFVNSTSIGVVRDWTQQASNTDLSRSELPFISKILDIWE